MDKSILGGESGVLMGNSNDNDGKCDSRRVSKELPDPRLKGNFEEEEELQVMAYLAKVCLLLDPDARPTMSEVVQILLTIAPEKSKRRNFSFERYQDYTITMARATYELQQKSNSGSFSS
ncbi:receptor-like serine/threonine-protein kinase NCRK [Tanacetum coccineum]